MSPAFPLTSLASAYAGAKARQIRRDAILYGFIGLMALVVCLALFSAFAVFVAQSHGLLNGLLASAGLAVGLAGQPADAPPLRILVDPSELAIDDPFVQWRQGPLPLVVGNRSDPTHHHSSVVGAALA